MWLTKRKKMKYFWMKELRAIYSHGFNLDLGDGKVKNSKVMTDFNFPCLDRVVRCQTSGNKY